MKFGSASYWWKPDGTLGSTVQQVLPALFQPAKSLEQALTNMAAAVTTRCLQKDPHSHSHAATYVMAAKPSIILCLHRIYSPLSQHNQ
jgi:hypothetical protein